MPRIFDFGGRDVERSQTVAGLRALKKTGQRATQVTAETADEAAAAEAAGIEMVRRAWRAQDCAAAAPPCPLYQHVRLAAFARAAVARPRSAAIPGRAGPHMAPACARAQLAGACQVTSIALAQLT